jgi:hypothetical protein
MFVQVVCDATCDVLKMDRDGKITSVSTDLSVILLDVWNKCRESKYAPGHLLP